MSKKFLPLLATAFVLLTMLFSCNKTKTVSGDPTKNYFPIRLGAYVSYEVDSTIYMSDSCKQYETRTQVKYAIDDTFRDAQNRLSYIMNVYTRWNDLTPWASHGTILITPDTIYPTILPPPAGVPTSCILMNQDGNTIQKMVFPMQEGITWDGNQFVNYLDGTNNYLKNWMYTYENVGKNYNNGKINFEKTATVLETDQSVNYPHLDSAVSAYRIYSKSVYGYNVGMIYREYTHWNYTAYNAKCVGGFSVIMRAFDHN